jgi:hypothetical protein
MSESEYPHQSDPILALASNDTMEESNAQGQAGQANTAVDEAISGGGRCGDVTIMMFEQRINLTFHSQRFAGRFNRTARGTPTA